MHVCECVHTHVCVIRQVWILDDNLHGSVLSFHHVGSGDLPWAARLGGKYFYILSHLFSTGLCIELVSGTLHKNNPVIHLNHL